MNFKDDFLAKKAMTLWMGDLDDGMEEPAISAAFVAVGETVTAVKCIKNRFDGKPAGYAFVEFPSIEASQRALLRLNGKPIPDANPPKRFKLNTASKNRDGGEEYSIFVGDLTDEVDDYSLYESFQKRYASCKGAKVVLGAGGVTRGFGFVRFSNQAEQMAALREMQNFSGLGGRPIRVSSATPRKDWGPRGAGGGGGGGGDGWGDRNSSVGGGGGSSGGGAGGAGGANGGAEWGSGSNSNDPQQWQQWQQYYQQQQQYWQYQQYSSQWGDYWQQNYPAGQNPDGGSATPDLPAPPPTKASKSDDPNEAFDVEGANAELIARSEDFMKTIDDSQWFSEILNFPCVAAN